MITGVGQGYLTTTPMQLAVMTAIFANNGKKYSLQFLKVLKKLIFMMMRFLQHKL